MSDLTRWNRQGLNRFQYVDGNAAEYLESLRKNLYSRFPEWTEVDVEEVVVDDEASKLEREEALIKREEQLIDQYEAERKSWAWEITRSFSRTSHVLTEYINAYANEAFLNTATQWESVKKLVNMIDYHPSPPASASTPLSLQVKKNKSGTVLAGLQFKYSPESGDAVIFETLSDIDVDATLNKVLIEDYNRSPDAVSGDTIELQGVYEDLTIGDPIVLVTSEVTYAFKITALVFEEESTVVTLNYTIPVALGLKKGDITIHLMPADKLSLLGPVTETSTEINNSVALENETDSLLPGDVVTLQDGSNTYFRQVQKVDGKKLYFRDSDMPVMTVFPSTAYVSESFELSVGYSQTRGVIDSEEGDIYLLWVLGDYTRLTGEIIGDFIYNEDEGHSFLYSFEVFNAQYIKPDSGEEKEGYTLLKVKNNNHHHDMGINPQTIWVPSVTKDWPIDGYLEKKGGAPLTSTITTEMPKKSSVGDYVVVQMKNQLSWGELSNVSLNDDESTAEMTCSPWQHRGGGNYYLNQTIVYSHFKEEAHLVGWTVNNMSIEGLKEFTLELDEVPSALRKGSSLLFRNKEDETVNTMTVESTKIDNDKVVLTTTEVLDDLTATVSNTVIYGNVLIGGHGEGKAEKILGSGVNSQNNQSFNFPVQGVSFVADSTMPTGVAASIEISVGNEIWTQVGSLRDSGPADWHYTVEIEEDETITVKFGDGELGRRLPTGTNNIRISYRKGVGSTGNVVAGSFVKPDKPHNLVEAVKQFSQASGGNDIESVESLKEDGPATLFALERAVSLEDFSRLAATHSSVWQARAFILQEEGRHLQIQVVVVPANGTDIEEDPELKKTIKDFIMDHAVPGVQITILPYIPVALELDVTINVDSSKFDPDEVESNVRENLSVNFTLKKRKLNQVVYLSEIYQVVEGTEGVKNSVCELEGDSSVQVISTTSEQDVIYLIEEEIPLTITVDEVEK